MGFNRLQSHITREVREKLGRVAKDVLVELGNHSDNLGVCWPGIGRLAESTGYADEVVRDALVALEAADYIRMLYRYSGVRRRWEFEAYQLSPDVVFLNQEYIGQAWDTFLNSQRYCNISGAFVGKESQQNQQQNQKQNQEQNQEQNQSTTTTAFEEAESGALDMSKKQGQRQRAKEQSPTAPNGANQKAAPPGARPSPRSDAPPPVSFAEYQSELPDELENIAQQLWVNSGNLPMPIARYLVVTYGRAICQAALKNYGKARDVVNPGGYLRSIIERRAVSPAYDDLPDAPVQRAGDDEWVQ
jgi:hypothetical protein